MENFDSDAALILAPVGRDAAIAAGMLGESGISSLICPDLDCLARQLGDTVAFVLVTEEALLGADLRGISAWIGSQPDWSDMPFVLLTRKGGGIERNPEAKRLLDTLGNVTFLERPFHPTTLVSLARAALRARRRQYEARSRLKELEESEDRLREANETLEARVEERTREHELALAKLHEAQKLETLGRLTGGVAHDFNNLLTPVIGNLDLLRRQEQTDRSRRLIDASLQAAGRAATLVQRLLAFARRQDLRPRSVNIAALLDGMTDLIRRSLDPSIHVQISHSPDLPPARVDPNQLELAILNLSINARDAMPRGGNLTINATAESVENRSRIDPGDYVRISVSDDGMGMDADVLARAIEPFFSTKGVGKGTGLGLSMVHGLAAQLGGMLDIRSSRESGTVAEIWLPVATEPAVHEELDSRPLVAASERATILLVDDEELVRSGTADMLSDLGYEVIEADSGSDALRLLRGGAEPDLLITDYLMPGMNGVELIDEARTLVADLKVMLITGYSTIAEGPGSSVPRLSKPFRQADLAEFVAELLVADGSSKIVEFPAERSR